MSAVTSDESLVELGLTALEARIYTFLLQESPVTGYRIAQAVGKPAANVYKALEMLEQKGIVEVDRGKTSLFRPVPADQLLDTLEAHFKRHRDRAAEQLQDLPGPSEDTRIYHLRNRDQVYGRCRQMLQDAKQVVLLDLFLKPLFDLGPDIQKAIDRGLRVVLKVYSPVEIDGAELLLEPEHELIRERWPAQWINMSADGSQMLLALLDIDCDEVIQAVWSSSPFLSWIHHIGVGNEFAFTALRRDAEDISVGGRSVNLNDVYHKYVIPDAPGYLRLLGQLGLHPETGGD